MTNRRSTSVYVHFPWCAKKCPYCDFATRAVAPDAIPHAAYADAVARELDAWGPRWSLDGRRLDSVFFGGGTPSLWDPAALGAVLARIEAAFPELAPDLEVTAECNPSSFDDGKAAALVDAGVGRVSIGVQRLDDAGLTYLGRLHDTAGALAAVRAAVARVPRVSADLMFGSPGQTTAGLEREIDTLLGLGVRHVSAYALTIEPGTLFGELHRKGRLPIASDDDYADLYEHAERVFARAGFHHYEVSNYAAPGEAARHNQHYWRGGDYLGLGAAAVGCVAHRPGAAERWRNEPDPVRYLAGDGRRDVERLGPQELVREALMLGLRTDAGVDLDEVASRTGVDPLEGRAAAFERRLGRGDLVRDGQTIRVPHARWLGLDGIVADLF